MSNSKEIWDLLDKDALIKVKDIKSIYHTLLLELREEIANLEASLNSTARLVDLKKVESLITSKIDNLK